MGLVNTKWCQLLYYNRRPAIVCRNHLFTRFCALTFLKVSIGEKCFSGEPCRREQLLYCVHLCDGHKMIGPITLGMDVPRISTQEGHNVSKGWPRHEQCGRIH